MVKEIASDTPVPCAYCKKPTKFLCEAGGYGKMYVPTCVQCQNEFKDMQKISERRS